MLTVDCRVSLSVVVVGSWFSVVGCQLLVLVVGCRVLVSVVGCRVLVSVIGCWVLVSVVGCRVLVSVVGCRVLVSGVGVDCWCRLSLNFSIVGAQLWGQIQRKLCCMWFYAGVVYNLTLCTLQSRLQHMYSYHGNPKPQSTLTLCQSRLYPPVRDFGFGLCYRPWVVIEIFLNRMRKDDARGWSSSYNDILLGQ